MQDPTQDGPPSAAPGALTVISCVLVALAIVAQLAFAISWFLLMQRINFAPSTPSVEQTIPHMRHGATVFITPRDQSLLTWLPTGGAFFGIAIFALALLARIAWERDKRTVLAYGATNEKTGPKGC
jgi:hypothetical protein